MIRHVASLLQRKSLTCKVLETISVRAEILIMHKTLASGWWREMPETKVSLQTIICPGNETNNVKCQRNIKNPFTSMLLLCSEEIIFFEKHFTL